MSEDRIISSAIDRRRGEAYCSSSFFRRASARENAISASERRSFGFFRVGRVCVKEQTVKKNENELENNYEGGAQTASETEGAPFPTVYRHMMRRRTAKRPEAPTRLSEMAVQP